MMPNDENRPANPGPCPVCGKPSVVAFRPFCSKRCADVDLQRWLSGRYAIPLADEEAEPADESEDEA